MYMLKITAIISNVQYFVVGLASPSAFNDEDTWVKTALLAHGQPANMLASPKPEELPMTTVKEFLLSIPVNAGAG